MEFLLFQLIIIASVSVTVLCYRKPARVLTSVVADTLHKELPNLIQPNYKLRRMYSPIGGVRQMNVNRNAIPSRSTIGVRDSRPYTPLRTLKTEKAVTLSPNVGKSETTRVPMTKMHGINMSPVDPSETSFGSDTMMFTHFHREQTLPKFEEKQEQSVMCYTDWASNETNRLREFNGPSGDVHSIYLLDMTCRSKTYGQVILGDKEVCTLISAARNNPNATIYYLSLVPIQINVTDDNTLNVQLLKHLLSFGNIRMRYLNVTKFFNEASLGKWFANIKLRTPMLDISHIKKLLRSLILWRYGGTFLDQNTIITLPFNKVNENFILVEVNGDALSTNSIIHFQNRHDPMLGKLMEDTRNYLELMNGADSIPSMEIDLEYMKSNCPSPLLRLSAVEETCGELTDLEHMRSQVWSCTDWQNYFGAHVAKTDDTFRHTLKYVSCKKVLNLALNITYNEVVRQMCPSMYLHLVN